ncbi:TonB-dependent receptor [Endozoicomonas sp. G2_1]|uniref:TonB-dependent receptor n=1 Tax=Endozoicomonas sp. G2_1 TaxID=2821091 RepID=UPI001ADAA15F|nr:TonB-dependent receptor [Endozoicomonas sp. G2_1]MBO9492266.1 TonB-dependent receptor [Endozoicomonas sp. G2_1]
MMKTHRLSQVAGALVVALGLSTAAFADETSSGVRGVITTPQGQPAAGTKIVITHLPSGTKKTVTTNSLGGFQAKGLRVGGPYKVTIDSDEYQDQEITDLFLQLGETERLNAQLEADQVEKIVVTASAAAFTSSAGSSYFGEEAIQNAASLTRDVKDVIRANPLVSILPGSSAPITIAGSNPRFNSITVDGISQNDDFGLNDGGYPTQRSPLPFDALDQVTVDTVPFDAKVSGFSGGLVNAVLKSGTNEFTGGFFYERLSDGLGGIGDVRDNGRDIEVEIDEKTYGAHLGGAIIEDKLFFFAAYEFFEAPQTLEWGAAGSGAANETDATLAEVQQITDIARSVYGLTDEQIGSPTGSPLEEDEKWVAKIDWNINDFHRAAFTYQFNEGNRTRNLTDRDSELRLSSQWYNVSETLNNYSVKLYSDWTDSFSTEISYTNKDVENRQNSFGQSADVTIDNLPSGGRIAFGTDRFRQANTLDTETEILKVDAEYLFDFHSVEFGVEYQELSIANVFVPGSLGVLEFDSIEDFRNRRASSYEYSNGTGNNPAAASAIFQRETLSLYIQDTWDYSDELTLTFGLRYERLGSDDKPPFNQNSLNRTGIDNTENLDGLDIVLPRFGFKYEVNEDVTIKGGVGRYTGGQPNVWVSNAYSENGVTSGFFSADDVVVPANAITNILPEASAAIENAQSNGNVSLTDPNFKLPNDWRYRLAVDSLIDIPVLGEDVQWTNEFLYIDRKDTAFWRDASLQESDILGRTADGGRILYRDDDNRYDLLLTNADDGGRSKIFATSLSKYYDNGVSWNFSYTNQDITEANPGTSSTARSNYRFSPAVNRNVAADHLGTGRFEIEHRFVFNFGYKTEFFEGYETNFNVFFERRSGQPVSYVLNRNRSLFRDTLSPGFDNGNFLPYIPTAGDANVVYDGVTEAEVLATIDAAGLSSYAGGYAPKNSVTTPWVNTLDLSFRQEIPGILDGHKGEIYFVFDNFLNFIDSSQGKVEDSDFGTLRLYDTNIDDQGRYVITGVRDDSFSLDLDQSSWKIKVGVKYKF